MSKTTKQPTVRMPSVEEDKIITTVAKADPDAQPLTPKQLREMVPLKSWHGQPTSNSQKVLISIRCSPEVVAYFQSTGDDWQEHIDSVLRQYVDRHLQE